MELFINQGKDSTIEPAYLTETKQAIPEPVLISKTITENDTYNAVDDNADGYSSVTVNVPTGAEVFEVTISGQASLEMNVETGDIEGQVINPVSNKTYAQIMAAISANKFIKIIYIDTNDNTKSHETQCWLFKDLNTPSEWDTTIMVPILSIYVYEQVSLMLVITQDYLIADRLVYLGYFG